MSEIDETKLFEELRWIEKMRHSEELERAEYERKLRDREREDSLARRRYVALRVALLYITMLLAGTFVYVGLTGNQWGQFIAEKFNLIIGVAIVIIAASGYLYTNKKVDFDFVDVDLRRRNQRAAEPAAAWPFPTSTRPSGDLNTENDGGFHDAEYDEDHKYPDDINNGIEAEEAGIRNEHPQRSSLSQEGDSGKTSSGPLKFRGGVGKSSFITDGAPGTDALKFQFAEITRILVERADDADEKASLLLSKGTNYTQGGIVFFILSILGWQILCAYRGFQTEFIYGMVSSTGLFVFIEFLSAWFLKQYRQYVDTATYLLRVKAIFDRYLLIYLAHNSFDGKSKMNQDAAARTLIKALEAKFPWPNSYMLRKEASSFADEATGALSKLARELRRERKRSKKRPEEKSTEK
jgi:hypothetical protein